jgi:hypothetical protein
VNTANQEPVLTSQEAARFRELEHIIEEGLDSFLKTGLAFAQIRFFRLYRQSHATFESYCLARWSLSLARCNQIISTVKVFDNLTTAFPQDAPVLSQVNEHGLRPLSRLRPDLQAATWELIRQIEQRPRGTTIEEVVSTIRNAISDGWQERERQSAKSTNQEPTSTESSSAESSSAGVFATSRSTSHNGTTKDQRLAARQSDQLGNLCRWANRITNWDPAAIAMADDELCLKRRLKAARQLRTFCEALIRALEARLLGQNPATTTI